MGRILALCAFLGLPLSGCVETVARATVEASYLADTATNYAHDVHMVRQWIRMRCFEKLMGAVAKLDAEGKQEEGTALLIRSYPGVVTISILKEVYKDPKSILSTPFGCPIYAGGVDAPVVVDVKPDSDVAE